MSAENNIITALAARLALITTANGYNTDAGLKVFRELEYQTALPEKPCIIVMVQETTSGFGGEVPPSLGEENHFLQVSLEGFIADSESAEAAALLKQDFMRCIKGDPYLGGLTEGFEGNITGKTSVAESDEGFIGFVQVSYTIFYVTAYGQE